MGIEAKPTMIKPNIDEIRMLTGKSCDNFQDMVDAAKQIHADGVEIVAVSLGETVPLSYVTTESFAHVCRRSMR